MTISIVEQIGAFIEAAVNDITVANGFQQDLTATRTKRLTLDEEVFDDLTTRIWQHKSDSQHSIIVSSGREPRLVRQRYLLWAVVLQSDKAEWCIDTKINAVRSDIEKKLCEDPTCGGRAKFLDIIETETTDYPETGVLITIEVIYMVRWNDPYTKT